MSASALVAALVAGYGGEVAVVAPGPLTTFDPAFAWTPAERVAASLLHAAPATLVDGPLPAEVKTATLVLRAGARFHDGSPLDAPAAARSLQRLLRPSAARPPLCPFPRGEVRASGPLEVQVTLFAPADLGAFLRQPCAAFLPAREPAAGAPPPGLGAFRFAGREGAGIRAQAYEEHLAGRPLLDGVRLYPAGARLATAPAELPRGIGHPPPTGYFVVNPQRADARALAAFAAALDRADVLRLVKAPAQPLAAAEDPGAPSLPRRANPAILAHDAVEGDHRAVAQRLQLRLHERGYATRIASEAAGELLARLRAGDYDAAIVAPPEPAVLAIAAGAEAARLALPLYAESAQLETPPSIHGPPSFDLMWVWTP